MLTVAFAAAVALTLVLSQQRQRATANLAALAEAEREKNEALVTATRRAETGEAQVNAILETMLDGVLTISPARHCSQRQSGRRQNVRRPLAGRAVSTQKRFCDLLPETEFS